MGDLSTTAVRFKLIVKWVGITLIAFALLWVLWLFLIFMFRLIFPPATTTADNAFGSLPIPFQTTANNLSSINFILEVPGGLSKTTEIVNVYGIPNAKAELSSLDTAKKKARTAGLDSEPTKVSDAEWRWTNKKNTNKILNLNIITNNFTYSYDWKTDPNALEGVFKTTDDEIIKLARSYLRKFGALADDLVSGETKITYLKLVGNQRNIVGSYSEANAVEVAVYRDKVDGKTPMVEPDINQSLVKVTLSQNSNTEKQLLGIDFTYWQVDFKNLGTYSTRSQVSAFLDLKTDKALVSEGNDQTFDSVTISKVYLAYFNSSHYTRFLQPIYVFKGFGEVKNVRQNFTAYVAAIDSIPHEK